MNLRPCRPAAAGQNETPHLRGASGARGERWSRRALTPAVGGAGDAFARDGLVAVAALAGGLVVNVIVCEARVAVTVLVIRAAAA